MGTTTSSEERSAAASAEDDGAPEPARLLWGRADVAGFPRAWGWPFHLLRGTLGVLAVMLCLLLLPWALYTFWVLFETAAEIGVAPERREWPLRAAAVFAVLVVSGLAYLIQDHIALLGCDRARRLLEEKAGRMLGAAFPPETARFFVQLRAEGRTMRRALAASGAPEDVGWLIPLADRLEFVGDVWRMTLPRGLVREVRRGPNVARLGLGGSVLDLCLQTPEHADAGCLRLQSRDADRLSGTNEGARDLETTLRAWLAAGVLSV